MAQWFVVIDGVEQGPIDDKGLRGRAREGELSRETLVRRQDLVSPVSAGSIRGLFPPEASPSKDEGRSEAPQPEKQRTAADRIQELAQGAATLATIKKLQLHDLPQADYAVGAKAFEQSLPTLTDAFGEVRQLDDEIASLRAATPAPTNETLADRTKRGATNAKRRVEVERLLQRRKGLLTSVGRKLRENPELDSNRVIAAELAHAQSIADRIQDLEHARPALPFGRKSLVKYVTAAAAVLVAVIVLKDVLTQTPEERHAANLAKIAAERKVERERLEAEREADSRRSEELQEQRSAEAERLRLDHEARLEGQRRKADEAAQAAALEDERRRLEEEQADAAVAAEADAQALAERQRRQAEAERDRVRAEQEGIDAQKARERYAASAFGRLEFDANKLVTIGPSAKRLVSKVELRGVRLAKVQELIGAESWLALVSEGLGRSLEEYPTISEIDAAVHEISADEYFLVVSMRDAPPARAARQRLCRVEFADPSRIRKSKTLEDVYHIGLADVEDGWDAHPDGKGVLCRWYLEAPQIHLVVLDSWKFDDEIKRAADALELERAALAQKVLLGEVTEEIALKQFLPLAIKAQQALRTLANERAK